MVSYRIDSQQFVCKVSLVEGVDSMRSVASLLPALVEVSACGGLY